jgi:hypothetical protein
LSGAPDFPSKKILTHFANPLGLGASGFRRNNPQPKYENNMRNKLSPRALVYAGCAIFALTTAFAQNVDVRHDPKDSKSVPLTQEPEPGVQFLLESGYTSEYIFRGTNLMPGAIGGYFYQAQATIPKVGPGSLTLGLWGINQIGDAQANTWSTSEGGGGSGVVGQTVPVVDSNGNPVPPFIVKSSLFPTTRQTSFREIDIFSSYRVSLGPVDLTLGNIVFLISREATTSMVDVLPSGFTWANPPIMPRSSFAHYNNVPTVGDENFDRIYIQLSSTKIPHITPKLTYYQTVYSNGFQPTGTIQSGLLVLQNVETGQNINYAPLGKERNDELGGYLEARLNGNFPVGHWLAINPYGVVSYSFRDRTEPVMGTFAGRPLTGFNNAEAGLELEFHITPNITFVPVAHYSYHISEPPIGTNRNEFWAGVKVSVNLP